MSVVQTDKEITKAPVASSHTNNLFPVFLKLEELSVLIVGGGNVGLEKLHAVLQNSPATKIRLVATSFSKPHARRCGHCNCGSERYSYK